MADFQAQVGSSTHPGLADQETRLARLIPGQNPYSTGYALPPDAPMFFGRARQLGETLNLLRRPDKPGSVSVLGERRFGKSSFLNQVRQALAAESDLVCIWATTQDWAGSSPATFFAGLHQAILRALAQRDGLATEPTGTTAEPGTDAAQTDPVAANGYAELRDTLRPLARQGLKFVLLLDELEGIADKPAFDADFFSNLRALGERPEYRFGYLIASRRPLKELCRDHRIEASSFWNIFGFPQYLGLLDETDALALAREPLARTLPSNRLLDPGGFWRDEIEPLTGCHPCLIQLVLDRHWLALSGGYPPDPDQIGAGLRDFLEDLWFHRHDKGEWRVLIQAAGDHPPKDGHVVRDLRLRGLLRGDGRLFCDELGGLVPELIPGGMSVADAIKRFNDGGAEANKLLETLEDIARRAGRVWGAFKHPDAAGSDADDAS